MITLLVVMDEEDIFRRKFEILRGLDVDASKKKPKKGEGCHSFLCYDLFSHV